MGWLAVALVFCTAACSPAANTTQTGGDACSIDGQWDLEFRRDGGIMGLSQTIELNSDGNLTAQDSRSQASFTRTLSTTQLSQIEGQLAQACPFEVQKTEQTCADCFFYSLTFRTMGVRYQAQASDIAMPPDLQPLIQTLTSLLDEAIIH